MTDIKNQEKNETDAVNRQWVSPSLTVLNAGSTAVGANPTTVEAFNYYPS